MALLEMTLQLRDDGEDPVRLVRLTLPATLALGLLAALAPRPRLGRVHDE